MHRILCGDRKVRAHRSSSSPLCRSPPCRRPVAATLAASHQFMHPLPAVASPAPSSPPHASPASSALFLNATPRVLVSWAAEASLNERLNLTVLNVTNPLHLAGVPAVGPNEALPCAPSCTAKGKGGPCASCGKDWLCCRNGASSLKGVCDKPLKNLRARFGGLGITVADHLVTPPKGWLCLHPKRQAAITRPGAAPARLYNPLVHPDGSISYNIKSRALVQGLMQAAVGWVRPGGRTASPCAQRLEAHR